MSDFDRDERLDRIEQPKSLKVNDELQGDVLKSIQSALIGDNFNGNKRVGFTWLTILTND